MKSGCGFSERGKVVQLSGGGAKPPGNDGPDGEAEVTNKRKQDDFNREDAYCYLLYDVLTISQVTKLYVGVKKGIMCF